MSIDLPTLKPSWTRFIVDYNPCFLLSAICMLVGCRLLNDTINLTPGDLAGALWLVLTINTYEFCLLGVTWLIQSRFGMRRDVGILVLERLHFTSSAVRRLFGLRYWLQPHKLLPARWIGPDRSSDGCGLFPRPSRPRFSSL